MQVLSFLNPVLEQGRKLWESYGDPLLSWGFANPVLAGGIIAGAIVFWMVPLFLMDRHIAGGNLRASVNRGRVKWLGGLGYLFFLVGGLFSKKGAGRIEGLGGGGKKVKTPKPKKLTKKIKGKQGRVGCPACQLAVDRHEDYAESLCFDRCPHCGAEIEPFLNFETYIQRLVGDLVEDARTRKQKRKRSDEDLFSSQAMSSLLNAFYTMCVRYRATDIHIERDAGGAMVQIRVDGVLRQVFHAPAIVASSFLSSIKVQASLDITNHMTPQDGRYKISVDGLDFDMRINCAPTSSQGEILFVRILDKRIIQIPPAELGFDGKNLEYFSDAVGKPHGLILVTGPTGSGKSTTLYVAMSQINTGARNIITIEDPVEYELPGLKQMQVNPAKNFSFATGLRSILRQDPDVIMVGEIRDRETANMAIDAAATGHLVFTTLHTMDTATAVARLNDLGVPSKRYAAALEIIIAQRLVRLICPNCKQSYQPTDEELRRLGILQYKDKIKFMAGMGCPACNESGYRGREAIIELFHPDEEMRSLLEVETRSGILRDCARRKGMRLLREAGALKAIAGRTTIEEVIRMTC